MEKIIDNSHLLSLVYNIPNTEDIEAVKTSLENFPRKTVVTKVITSFLSLI